MEEKDEVKCKIVHLRKAIMEELWENTELIFSNNACILIIKTNNKKE